MLAPTEGSVATDTTRQQHRGFVEGVSCDSVTKNWDRQLGGAMVEYAAAHAVIVNWYGPFSTPDDAVAWVRQNRELVPGPNSVPSHKKETDRRKPSGIYLAIGTLLLSKLQQPWKRLIQPSRLQYVGIGNVENRLKKKRHPIRTYLGRCDQIWVGALGSFPSPDDAPNIGHRIHDNQLELAEQLIAYFTEAPLNQRKREYTTPPAGILVNRWFRANDAQTVPFAPSPHRSVPDIILWPYDGPREDGTTYARDRLVQASPMLPSWLDQSLMKAALVRFNTRAGAASLRASIVLADATASRQFDIRLIRRRNGKRGTRANSKAQRLIAEQAAT